MPPIKCPYAPDCKYQTDEAATIDQGLKLLEMHERAHHTSAPSTASTARVEKFRRPTISGGGSSEDWAYFKTRWEEYSLATGLDDNSKVPQLLECCDEQLRRDLTRAAGGTLASHTEDNVLAAIRKLAVREDNTMVARFALHNMQQDADEPIRAFGARIKGQAGVCQFSVSCPKCETQVPYTDQVLRDVVVQGLYDQEIRQDVLGDQNQDMTFEEVMKFVEAKESGKRSATKLLHALGANATRSSSYRAQQKRQHQTAHPGASAPSRGPDLPGSATSDKLCSYCGKKGHGQKASPSVRKQSCPAYGTICQICFKRHHVDSMCRSKGGSNTITSDEQGAVFHQLCSTFDDFTPSDEVSGSATAHPGANLRRSIDLDHHLYDELHGCWSRQPSMPQPFLDLHVVIANEDYEALGFQPVKAKGQGVTLSVMADTGCQSSLAGIHAIRRLGIDIPDLIPVRMRMHAANEKPLNILGAAILRFCGRSPNGHD